MMSERADDKRIVMEVIQISTRIYGVPKFRFYAVADGMFTVFARSRQGISQMLEKKRRSGQMCLFPKQSFSSA